jgi:hypothetical protein
MLRFAKRGLSVCETSSSVISRGCQLRQGGVRQRPLTFSFHIKFCASKLICDTIFRQMHNEINKDNSTTLEMPPSPSPARQGLTRLPRPFGQGRNSLVGPCCPLRARGVEFINVPETYYTTMRLRLKTETRRWKSNEDFETVQRLRLLNLWRE